ncbi:MAG: transcriptional repressor LexA [Candidatus Gastranaerophilaceae bacterium]
MPNEKLTPKQEEILNFIKQEILAKGYPPSVREICEAVTLKSTSSVHAHLESLERKGYIRKDPTKPRTIEVVDDSFNVLRSEIISIPMIGRVAAGVPLLAEENIEGYFPIPAEFMPNNEAFILTVHGNSMINIGILDGDMIIVERKSTASNGEIVVALVADEASSEPAATVKRFYKEDGYIRLQPENDTMEPLIVNDCEIIGKVIGVYRKMT